MCQKKKHNNHVSSKGGFKGSNIQQIIHEDDKNQLCFWGCSVEKSTMDNDFTTNIAFGKAFMCATKQST